MPNLAALLKEAITRLSRREVRRQLGAMKKASAQYRRHIAAMRRQIGSLERQLAVLRKRALEGTSDPATATDETETRFVAKGLHSHRARLGFSAKDYGRLAGVRCPDDLQLGTEEVGSARAAARLARRGARPR